LLGRFPIVTHLDKLTKETMLRILTEPKNSIINQFVELFRLDGIKIAFTEKVLEEIVNYTLDKGLGARGLRGTTEKILEDFMYSVDTLEKELIIDVGNVKF
jgi:ATP-dependent Clp protease ATP-binding subunit ClpX